MKKYRKVENKIKQPVFFGKVEKLQVIAVLDNDPVKAVGRIPG